MAALEGTRVHGWRAVVLWAIRAVAAWLVGYGVFLVLARFVFSLMSGHVSASWSTWTSVGETHGLVRGAPMIVCGVVLALVSRRLARWIVAAPEGGCARCGYASEGGRCPECGFASGDSVRRA